jgi:hypothetical protein
VTLSIAKLNFTLISIGLFGLLILLGKGFDTYAYVAKVFVVFLFFIFALPRLSQENLMIWTVTVVIAIFAVLLGNSTLSESLALCTAIACMMLAQNSHERNQPEKAGLMFSTVIVLLSISGFVVPLIGSENYTYYGTTPRGEFSSVLDASFIVAGLLIANYLSTGRLIINILGILVLYYWIPARSLIFFALMLLWFDKAKLSTKVILIAFMGGVVLWHLLQNEYFMIKVTKMFAGDEQRMSALQCGIEVMSKFNAVNIFFGMGYDDFKRYTNQCLPDARLIEADLFDLLIRFGMVPLLVYILYLVSMVRKSIHLFWLGLYGLFFGHVAFNPLTLIPIAIVLSYQGNSHVTK